MNRHRVMWPGWKAALNEIKGLDLVEDVGCPDDLCQLFELASEASRLQTGSKAVSSKTTTARHPNLTSLRDFGRSSRAEATAAPMPFSPVRPGRERQPGVIFW